MPKTTFFSKDKKLTSGAIHNGVPLQDLTSFSFAAFASPKSASFTDPLASTNILAHLISLQVQINKY
uniref:Uncharacterized protein n=1 Tax=Rhizophora mucronata TaxID=61149 RepID=A0A2P2KAV8_RHIMU